MNGALAALALVLAWAADPAGAADATTRNDASADCRRDLAAIAPFLLANDAGAHLPPSRAVVADRDEALEKAQRQAADVADVAACEGVLRTYLRVWRKGHLAVRTVADPTSTVAPASPRADIQPQLQFLSERTALLRIPTFAGSAREPLAALLRDQAEALSAHPFWIIDVRRNGGGDDETYASLLPWLLPDAHVELGAEWWVTQQNIAAQAAVCALMAPGDAACERFTAAAVERMRGAPPESYVAQSQPGPHGNVEFVPGMAGPKQRPQRVALLIDRGCGSSCEEFVLVARQSFAVKVLGRPTFGSLDYSNMRPHALPSGRRVLWYATSRSARLPEQPIDDHGILPDIALSAPADAADVEADVRRARRWLEGGSLAPDGP